MLSDQLGNEENGGWFDKFISRDPGELLIKVALTSTIFLVADWALAAKGKSVVGQTWKAIKR